MRRMNRMEEENSISLDKKFEKIIISCSLLEEKFERKVFLIFNKQVFSCSTSYIILPLIVQ
jgi:hypothetical protein